MCSPSERLAWKSGRNAVCGSARAVENARLSTNGRRNCSGISAIRHGAGERLIMVGLIVIGILCNHHAYLISPFFIWLDRVVVAGR